MTDLIRMSLSAATGVALLAFSPLAMAEESRELPDGYESIPYLESSGTQWIDPQYNVASDARIEAEFGHITYVEGDYSENEKNNSMCKTLFGGSVWEGEGSAQASEKGRGNAILGIVTYTIDRISFRGTRTTESTLECVSATSEGDDFSVVIVNSDANESVIANLTQKTQKTFTAGAVVDANVIGKPFYIFTSPAPTVRPENKASAYRLKSMKLYGESALKRDLVPARRFPDGELGLYDLVEGKFFTNKGTGTFSTAGAVGRRLTYIRSNGTQKINSIWTTTSTCRSFEFWFADYEVNKYGTWSMPGGYLGDGSWGKAGGFLIADNTSGNGNYSFNWFGNTGARARFAVGGTNDSVKDGNYDFIIDNVTGGLTLKEDGQERETFEPQEQFKISSGTTIAVFGLQNKVPTSQSSTVGGYYCYSIFSLYGIAIDDPEGGDHEFLPYLNKFGVAAIADAKNGYKFYPPTAVFPEHGIAYDLVGKTIKFSAGTLTAKDMRALKYGPVDFDSFEKVSLNSLLTGDVEKFNDELVVPVTISEGTWSLTNGVAKTQTHSKLTLKGGAAIQFGAHGADCDKIYVPNGDLILDRDTVSADNPIKIILDASKLSWEGHVDGYELIVGGNLRRDEHLGCFKLVVEGAGDSDDIRLEIDDRSGNLKIVNDAERTPFQAKWEKGEYDDRCSWHYYDIFGEPTDGELTRPLALKIPAGTTDFRGVCPLPWHDKPLEFETTDGAFRIMEDADWSEFGDLSQFPAGLVVDLYGYELQLPSPTAAVPLTFTDKMEPWPWTPEESGRPAGKAVVSVGEGVTSTNEVLTFTGGLQFVKEGLGTLVMAKGGMDYAAGTVVNEGLLKMGVTVIVGDITNIVSGISTKGKVTVTNGGGFDLNGIYDSVMKYEIAGTCTDGGGALRNSGASIDDGKAQIISIKLLDDALITAEGDFGLINKGHNAATLELGGHELTIQAAPGVRFWAANVSCPQSSGQNRVHVTGGNVCFCHKPSALDNVDFIVDGENAVLQIPSANPPSKVTLGMVTFMNGGAICEAENKLFAKRYVFLDGAKDLHPAVKWIYATEEFLVSNETEMVELQTPLNGYNNDCKANLVKQGAGTLVLSPNNSCNRLRGADIQTGTVVLDSSATPRQPQNAFSDMDVPVTIRKGAALDITRCGTASGVYIGTLTLDGGAIIKCKPGNFIQAKVCKFSDPTDTEKAIIRFEETPMTAVKLLEGVDRNAPDRFAIDGVEGNWWTEIREDGNLWAVTKDLPVYREWVEGAWICTDDKHNSVTTAPNANVTTLLLPQHLGEGMNIETAIPLRAIQADDPSRPVVLDEDINFTGLDLTKFADKTKFHLSGHTLALTGVDGEYHKSLTIANVEEGGKLALHIPEDVTMKIGTEMGFEDSFILEKSGLGTIGFLGTREIKNISFNLSDGSYSMADGVVARNAFKAFKAVGGTRIVADIGDRLEGDFDLTDVSTTSPITLVSAEMPLRGAGILLKDGTLTEADLAKFTIEGDGVLSLENGNIDIAWQKGGYTGVEYAESLGGADAPFVTAGRFSDWVSNDQSPHLEAAVLVNSFSLNNNRFFCGFINDPTGYLRGSLAFGVYNEGFSAILSYDNKGYPRTDLGSKMPGMIYQLASDYNTLKASVVGEFGESPSEVNVVQPGRKNYNGNHGGSFTIGSAQREDGAQTDGCAARLYSIALRWKGVNYRYLPVRNAAGDAIGFYDLKEDCPLFCTDPLRTEFGSLCGSVEGNSLVATYGVLDERYTYMQEYDSYSTLVKRGPLSVRVTSSLKALNAIAIEEGTLDFSDAVQTNAIGLLRMTGGAVLKLSTAAEKLLKVDALDLKEASAGSPAVISVEGDCPGNVHLLSCRGLSSAVLDKIALEGLPATLMLEVREDGLWAANDKRPVAVRWNAQDEKWDFFNGDGEVIDGELVWDDDSHQIPLTMPSPAKMLPEEADRIRSITAEKPLVLEDDLDWSAVPLSAFASMNIDLSGHALAFGGSGVVASEITITNSVEDTLGMVTISVIGGEGTVLDNQGVLLQGNIRLVTDGDGTFRMTKSPQTYTGGTLVRGGTLTTPARNGSADLSHAPFENGFVAFGPQDSVIEVSTNGTFDIAGNYCYSKYALVLAGGTLKNSVTQGNGYLNWLSIGDLTLTADSKLLAAKGTHLGADRPDERTFTANLGGHTLDVSIVGGPTDDNFWNDQLHLLRYAFTNGTVRVELGGWLRICTAGEPWRDCTLDYAGGALQLNDGVMQEIENVTVRGSDDNGSYNKRYNGRIIITRTYKPVSDYYHDFTLMPGVTIDLSEHEKNGEWVPLEIAEAVHVRDGQGTGFSTFEWEPGKYQIVLPDDFNPTPGRKVIDWSKQPPATPKIWVGEEKRDARIRDTFRFVSPTRAFGFRADEEGVFVMRGHVLIIK